MTLTKGQLIKLLQDDKSPMDTPIGIYLECTNDDAGMSATAVRDAEYRTYPDKKFVIFGDYEYDC
jgi:hypothetical protein